jgi:hypothetical protein
MNGTIDKKNHKMELYMTNLTTFLSGSMHGRQSKPVWVRRQ